MAEKKHYATLDGLRGIAALAVMLHHATPFWGRQIAPSAYLAVDFFFLLSGFVLANGFEQRLRDGLGPRAFMWGRLKRLWPLFALGALLGGGAELLRGLLGEHALSPAKVVAVTGAALLFIPSPANWSQYLFRLNPPAWSVFFELLINLAFATLSVRLGNRALAVLTAVLGMVLFVLIARGGSNRGVALGEFHVGALRCAFSFNAGVLLFRFREAFIDRFRVPLWLALGGFFGLLMVQFEARAYDLLFVFLLSPLVLCLSASTARAPRPVRWMGAGSYPVYAVHVPIVLGVAAAAKAAHLTLLPIGCVTIAAISAAAPLLNLIDETVRKTRWSFAWPARPVSEAAR